MNEGNSSGVGIGCIDEKGNVHADQFWRHYSFGNVRERPFSAIWTDLSNPVMARLKEKETMCTAGVPDAGGSMSAAGISAYGPRRRQATSGRRPAVLPDGREISP